LTIEIQPNTFLLLLINAVPKVIPFTTTSWQKGAFDNSWDILIRPEQSPKFAEGGPVDAIVVSTGPFFAFNPNLRRKRMTQRDGAIGGTWGNAEAAGYIGCTDATLRTWVSKRRIPFVRVGRLIRFRKTDLDHYLDENLVSAK